MDCRSRQLCSVVVEALQLVQPRRRLERLPLIAIPGGRTARGARSGRRYHAGGT